MRTIEIKLYQYDELEEPAKEKAREWYARAMFDYDWWKFQYEDAECIGLKITGFDLERRTIEGELQLPVNEVCKLIRKEHGKTCGTYRLAKSMNLHKLNDDGGTVYKFRHALQEEYLSMLRSEVEYMESRESIEENIRANEYEFTADGRRG